ncbi:zinc finger CCCH domain-containing protein 11A [Mantella aurantiaca]
MSNQGDDCYFYFYSTCTKGDSCPFRHCKAALGNETVCTLWQEGCCFRQICKFRHMEIDKKRSMIPCFWENQLSGCQKGNCAFHHNKGRYVDGVYIPPSKTQIAKSSVSSETDQQISQTPGKFTAVSTTHLRGVKKIETAENVPSPTHPPVVINAADDDDDDEERDELKPSGQQGDHQGARHVTTQKMDVLSKDTLFTLNILESSQNPAITEKNVTVIRTVMFSNNDSPSMHRQVAQRLGKRKIFSQEIPLEAVSDEESFPAVKKPLSERLGKKMVLPIVDLDAHHKKNRAANPTTDFNIKTLQEILQEKASHIQMQKPTCLSIKNEDHFFLKSHIFIKPKPDIHIKSLHEIQVEKKLRQRKDGAQKDENKVDKNDCRVGRDLQTSQNFDNKNLMYSRKKWGGQADICNRLCERGIKPSHLTYTVPSRVDTKKPLSLSLIETKAISQPMEQVQVKTLEEIRKEKALKIQQNQQDINTETLEPVSQRQVKLNYKKILHLSKPQVNKDTDQSMSDTNNQTNNAVTAANIKTTVEFEPRVTSPVKISEKVGSDKTLEMQSLKSTNYKDVQKTTQPKAGLSVKSVKIILGRKGMPAATEKSCHSQITQQTATSNTCPKIQEGPENEVDDTEVVFLINQREKK